MKTPVALILILLVSIAAFFAGRGTSSAARDVGGYGTAAAKGDRQAERRLERSRDSARGTKKEERKERSGVDKLTVDEARLMTQAERMALLRQMAVLGDPVRQAQVLAGLIPAMTREELDGTTEVLLQAQGRGNAWSQEVWNELWMQWGRVDPEGCLAKAAQGTGLNTNEDYRLLMAGWLETAPNVALAWARKIAADPGAQQLSTGMAEAAAFALMRDAGGDVKKMEEAIRSVAGNAKVAKACLQDYFDATLASGGGKALPEAYDAMSPEMRGAAWPVVMYRLSYTDREQAKAWLEQHVSDPGRDYFSTYGMLSGLSRKDPKATVEWATTLPKQAPSDPDAGRQHPATVSLSYWNQRDPAAAAAWVATQPVDTPWALWWQAKFGNKNPAAPAGEH